MKQVLDFSSRLVPELFRAVFTTRHYPYVNPFDRIQLARDNHWPPERLVIPIQKHTAYTEIVTRPGKYEAVDGVITVSPDLVLSIQVADCIPLFIVEPASGLMGLVHAGWRGLVGGIIPHTFTRLKSLAVPLQTVQCFIGPSIRSCCFEIGNEILHHFPAEYHITANGKKTHIDLQRMARDQLIGEGAIEENIALSPACTKCDPLYHSYRRNGKKAGRMIAMLGRIRH
ncbi:MAG: polyphenol oxidase family protein [Fidelibacterota bacterium]